MRRTHHPWRSPARPGQRSDRSGLFARTRPQNRYPPQSRPVQPRPGLPQSRQWSLDLSFRHPNPARRQGLRAGPGPDDLPPHFAGKRHANCPVSLKVGRVDQPGFVPRRSWPNSSPVTTESCCASPRARGLFGQGQPAPPGRREQRHPAID